jgi:hypothetical protein
MDQVFTKKERRIVVLISALLVVAAVIVAGLLIHETTKLGRMFEMQPPEFVGPGTL